MTDSSKSKIVGVNGEVIRDELQEIRREFSPVGHFPKTFTVWSRRYICCERRACDELMRCLLDFFLSFGFLNRTIFFFRLIISICCVFFFFFFAFKKILLER